MNRKPKCPRCSGEMIVRIAKQGPTTGKEFWGCQQHFTSGCRGTRELPPQGWDWFGRIPEPIKIIASITTYYRQMEEEWEITKYMAEEREREWKEHGFPEGHDEHSLAFEEAMEAAELLYGLEEEEYYPNEGQDVIDQVRNLVGGNHPQLTMAEGFLQAVSMEPSEALYSDIFEEFTLRYNGSYALNVAQGPLGAVKLDDESVLLFADLETLFGKKPSIGVEAADRYGWKSIDDVLVGLGLRFYDDFETETWDWINMEISTFSGRMHRRDFDGMAMHFAYEYWNSPIEASVPWP